MNNAQMQEAIKTLVPMPEWVAAWEARGNQNADAVTAYMSSAWMARAINIRADAIPVAPLKLYTKQDEEIEQHPILDLLNTVNDEWNKSDLWRYTELSLFVYPAAYWQKIRIGKKPRELFFVNAGTMKVNAGAGGIQSFSKLDGSITFPREDIVYFRGAYDPKSDLTGVALASWASIAAMSENNADIYLNAFFANGAVPPLVFASDNPVSETDMARFTQWWNKLFRGARNSHKTGIMGGGLKPIQLGSNLKDLSLTEVRAEIHRTISTITGVPELLISPTGADLTPVKMAESILYNMTILPRWKWYAEVLNSELLTEYSDLVKSGAYLAFDITDVPALQEDQQLKATRAKTYVDMGVPLVMALEMADIYLTEAQQAELSVKPEPIVVPPVVPAEQVEPPVKTITELNRWETKVIAKGATAVWRVETLPNAIVHQVKKDLARGRDIADTFADARRAISTTPSDDGMKMLAQSIDAMVLASVKTEAPSINLTMPAISLTAQMPAQGTVTVNVPDQPAPVVNVNVPQQPAPVVNVAAAVVTVPAPVVNVAPATITFPPAPTEATITTDRNGKKTMRVTK